MKDAKEKLNHFKTAVRTLKLIHSFGQEICMGYLDYNIVFT